MKKVLITIIGMGPRGLSVFDRIIALSRQQMPNQRYEIHLVDPKECGQGVHLAKQPPYLLTNTLACQVTMFNNINVESSPQKPSFTEWANQVGYRRLGNAYHKLPIDTGVSINEYDYLPRSLLGEYLMWAYEQLIANLPENIDIIHHRNMAVNILPLQKDHYEIKLDNKLSLISDYVFITTGHGKRNLDKIDEQYANFVKSHLQVNKKLSYFADAYPTDKFSTISADSVVAIQGFGLTAHDIVAELTVGRGGQFIFENDQLVYKSSGDEPHIILFSRNCLPFAARGVNQKGVNGQHKAVFFTVSAIKELQRQALLKRSNTQLDFVKEVLPLLFKEMGYAYRLAKQGHYISPENYEMDLEEKGVMDELFYPLKNKNFETPEMFQDFFMTHLLSDLEHANLGNQTSPIKAATDAIRDVREAMRLAVEFGGLTPESHRRFVQEYYLTMNRISFGPPKHRNAEWIALLNAGVIEIAKGPNSKVILDKEVGQFTLESNFPSGVERQNADVLILGKLDSFIPENDSSILIQNMLKQGLIRPFYNGSYHPGGIDIDTDSRPINSQNQTLQNIWAIGYLVEGPHFYTHALPRPGLNSRQWIDAEKCVRAMFGDIEQNRCSISEVASQFSYCPVLSQGKHKHRETTQVQGACV